LLIFFWKKIWITLINKVKPPRGKPPTRQSRYGDGTPWGILAKESKGI
jgi:hypothetical protein